MRENLPLISVVMPVFNAARFIPEALDSVKSQNYSNLEMIAIDDGSTDESGLILEKEGVRVLKQANQGAAAARNRGIVEARGEYVAFIDADDLWPAGKLCRQLAAFRNSPELDVVTGKTRCAYLDGSHEEAGKVRMPETVINVNLGAALFRASVFDRVGLFDAKLRVQEDLDWFMRAKEMRLNILVQEEIALIYRMHGSNTILDDKLMEDDLWKAIRASVVRRRNNPKLAQKLRKLSDFQNSKNQE